MLYRMLRSREEGEDQIHPPSLPPCCRKEGEGAARKRKQDGRWASNHNGSIACLQVSAP